MAGNTNIAEDHEWNYFCAAWRTKIILRKWIVITVAVAVAIIIITLINSIVIVLVLVVYL